MYGTVPGAGVELAYEESGSGQPIVLVHDMASDLEAVRPLADTLAPRARVISYSRRGYGGSTAPEPYAGTTVMEQAEDLAALLVARNARGAVGVGLGLGALIVLDVLTRHPGALSVAVLSDTPLFAFVSDAARALSDERVLIETAVRDGGPAAGVVAWLSERSAACSSARAEQAHQAFFADYAGLASWPSTRSGLRAITVPAAVVTTPGAPGHVIAASDALAALLPHARRDRGGDVAGAAAALLP